MPSSNEGLFDKCQLLAPVRLSRALRSDSTHHSLMFIPFQTLGYIRPKTNQPPPHLATRFMQTISSITQWNEIRYFYLSHKFIIPDFKRESLLFPNLQNLSSKSNITKKKSVQTFGETVQGNNKGTLSSAIKYI